MTDAPHPWTDLAIERLDKHHDRTGFACGNADIDEHLKRFARQGDERSTTRTYVLVERGSVTVRGYYAIRAGTLILDELPLEQRKRLPRYPVPTVHLARMGVDANFRSHQGKGRHLGQLLLFHGFRSTIHVADALGIFAMDVIAIDERAADFYRRHGFVPLLDRPMHMFMTTTAIRSLLA